jgi:hypothetical protein
MPYLPELFQKIDDYCKLVQAQTAWSMPDDLEENEEKVPTDVSGPGLYPRIVGIANEFSNENVTDEILLIAELYKKSLEMGGGYSQVNRMLSTTLSNMDDLIDEGTVGQNELDSVENILNEVSQDLRQRAKTSPSKVSDGEVIRQLKETRDAFNQKATYEEVTQQPSVFVHKNPGADNPAQQTGHTTGPRNVPETPRKYELEMAQLGDMLNNTDDHTIKKNIQDLINVVEQLRKQLPLTIDARDALKITPEDKEAIETLDQAERSLQSLRDQRVTLRRKLNKAIQNQKLNELTSRLASTPTKNIKERQWLEEQIKLQKLRLSTDVGKITEIKYRQMLIDSMGEIDSHGDFISLEISPELKTQLERGIQLGTDLRMKKSEYDRKRTEEKATQEGREAPRRESQRGGWSPGEKQLKIDSSNFPKLVNKIGPGINTAVAGATYYIARVKEGGKLELKEYVDNVAKSIFQLKKTSLPAKPEIMAEYKKAIEILREKAKAYILTKNPEAVASYEISIRLTPFLRKIQKDLDKIKDLQKEGQWNLSGSEKSFVRDTTIYIARLREVYNKQYGDKRSNFNSLINALLPEVQNYMEDYILAEKYSLRTRVEEPRIRVFPEEPKEDVIEHDGDTTPESKKRMQMLGQLLNNYKLSQGSYVQN